MITQFTLSKATTYLIDDKKLAPRTALHYESHWRNFVYYLYRNNIKTLNNQIAINYVKQRYNRRKTSKFGRQENYTKKVIEYLLEYIETGAIIFKSSQKLEILSTNQLGRELLDFLKFKEDRHYISKGTYKSYRLSLYRLWKYCQSRNVFKVDEIDKKLITDLIQVPQKSARTFNDLIGYSKAFFEYLELYKKFKFDFLPLLDIKKKIKKPNVSAIYSDEELDLILYSVTLENNPRSFLRNRAIISLLITTGLRGCEVAALKFEDCDLRNNKIRIIQSKTNFQLEKKLHPLAKKAIKKYLVLERPLVKSDSIFLQTTNGRKSTTGKSISRLTSRAIKSCRIDINGRSTGSHIFRHSYVHRLQETNTSVEDISQDIGHQRIESTQEYYRIDVTKLRSAALEVPPLVK